MGDGDSFNSEWERHDGREMAEGVKVRGLNATLISITSYMTSYILISSGS
jgi:hypothetical protein